MRRELFFLTLGGVLGAAVVLSGQRNSVSEGADSATLFALVGNPDGDPRLDLAKKE